MNRKALLMIVYAAFMSTTGRIMAQSRELTMSLEQLFRTADEHNTSIKCFESVLREAEAGVKAAKAERLPDIEARLSFSYLGGGWISDRDFSNGIGVHIPHYGNNLAIQASWALYTGGALTSGINLSRLASEMAQANAQENRQRVRMLLVGLYLQLHNLKNQEYVFEENIALTETLIEHTRKRQSEGVVLKNDITRYELQLEQLKLGRTQVQNKAKTANYRLATALGIGEGITILPAETFEADNQIRGTEEMWHETALYNSPSIRQAQLGVAMNLQKEKREKSALRPTIALVAEEHLDGPITIEIPNLNKNLNYCFVGVGMKYNFGALYKNSKRIRQARLATETAQHQQRAAIENSNDAVQTAYTDYLTSSAELETSRKSVDLAQQNYDVINNRYQNGLALVTDMTDAANQRLNAQLTLVNSRIKMLLNYYNLKFTTGTL